MRALELPKEKPEDFKILLESVNQLKELLDLIGAHGIAKREPIAGKCYYKGWDEIEVIGPTRQYYNEVFDQEKNFLRFISEEYELTMAESIRPKSEATLTNTNPCSLLKTTSNTTPTNKASAIILLHSESGKLLFTGDTGIESL